MSVPPSIAGRRERSSCPVVNTFEQASPGGSPIGPPDPALRIPWRGTQVYSPLYEGLLPNLTVGAMLFVGVRPATLPAPDPDDGAITLPPGFRALVVADNLVVGRKVGNTAEGLRGIAVAPNGDIYAKTQARTDLRAARHDERRPGRRDQRVWPGRRRHAHRLSRRLALSLEPHRRLSLQVHAGRARADERAADGRLATFPPSAITTRRRSPSTNQWPDARRDRITLQRLQQARSPARRERHGRDRVSEDLWRLLALRRQQAEPDASRRRALLDGPSPCAWRSRGTRCRRASSWCRWDATTSTSSIPSTTTRSTTPNACRR